MDIVIPKSISMISHFETINEINFLKNESSNRAQMLVNFDPLTKLEYENILE